MVAFYVPGGAGSKKIIRLKDRFGRYWLIIDAFIVLLVDWLKTIHLKEKPVQIFAGVLMNRKK
jgi:hypothetical protein